MTKGLDRLSPRDGEEKEWRAVIETPKGSHNKYGYSDELSGFELSKVLPQGMAFPFDFGFLPSTVGDDGDPLDVLLLMDQPTFPGCVVHARLIGVIEAEQTEKDGEAERNDRILAVPVNSRIYRKVRSIKDIDGKVLEEIEQFFVMYNRESGKKFELLGVRGPHRAEKLAGDGMKEFVKRAARKRSDGKRKK